MSPRPRHPRKELEAILRDAERQGWRVTKRPNSYYRIYCPCDGKHVKSVHLTPSNGMGLMETALGDLRTALHAAGCHTGAWPFRLRGTRMVDQLDLAHA